MPWKAPHVHWPFVAVGGIFALASAVVLAVIFWPGETTANVQMVIALLALGGIMVGFFDRHARQEKTDRKIEETTEVSRAGPGKVIHALENGAGKVLAQNTAEQLKPVIKEAADKVAEVAKDTADRVAQTAAAKGDELRKIATDVIVAERSSDQSRKRFEEGVAEGRRQERIEAEARQAAKTDLEIPILKTKQG